jgi:hypothetical protein
MSVASIVLMMVLAVLAVLAFWVTRTSRTEGLSLLSLNPTENNEKHPYFVQLVGTLDGKPFCGGVLIKEDVVLTAAHCIFDEKFDQMYCTIGDDNSGEPIEYRYVKKIIIPQNYINHLNDDIALLVLDFPVTTKTLCPRVTRAMLLPDTNAFQTKCIGRGYTNLKIAPYTRYSNRTLGDAKSYYKRSAYKDLPLTLPDKLQAFYPVTVSVQTSKILVEFKGSTAWPGDSGGPLLFKIDNEWQVAGVTSSSYNNDKIDDPEGLWKNIYTSIPFYEDWIDQTLAQIESDAISIEDTGITVHEIAHVVALARLKHLKKLADGSRGGFEAYFLKKRRWLDLADYLKDGGSRLYESLAYDANEQTQLARKKEAQLAVLWALVSSYDNYKVLQEMVTQSGPGIPYFLRLGYESRSGSLASFDGRQSFARDNVGGSAAWGESGESTLWAKDPKDPKNGKEIKEFDGIPYSYKATDEELESEPAQRNLRPKKKITAVFSNKRFLFLEGRPLRRRMFCDFMDALKEYLSHREKRPWFRKYLAFNNIESPERTTGLLECISPDPKDYVDGKGNPQSSYGRAIKLYNGICKPFAFQGTPQGTIPDPKDFLTTLNGMKLQERLAKGTTAWQWTDPSRAWLQASGDHWPVLAATTLYDTYAWIPMPDGKEVTITFREAMFLVLDEARVQVPGGVFGSHTLAPTIDVGFNRHPGANNIRQYNPSFLLYLYQLLPTLVSGDYEDARAFVKSERLRSAFVTIGWTQTKVQPYSDGDAVRRVFKSGLLRQTVVTDEIARGKFDVTPKNDRRVEIRSSLFRTYSKVLPLVDLLKDYNVQSSFDINFSRQIAINPVGKSWVSYPLKSGSRAWSMDLEPIGKKMDPRFSKKSTVPECAPAMEKSPAPATDELQQKPGDPRRGGGGDQEELDDLIAKILICI